MDESRFSQGLNEKLHTFMQVQGQRGEFDTSKNVKLAYQSFVGNCNDVAIFIIPGWSEPYVKYAEIIYELTRQSYCVHIYDHRGQGLSTRLLKNRQIGYVENFSDYVDDLERFYQFIVNQYQYKKIYYIAHSMGGLIALSQILNYSPKLTGVVLTAPMLKINTGVWPQPVAYAIVYSLDWLGYGSSYALGQGEYYEKPFDLIKTTRSEARYHFETSLFKDNPALIISGVSNRWLKTSIEQTNWISSKVQSINSMILLFQAGADEFVINKAADDFCERMKNCNKIVYKLAKHELLMEIDEVRAPVVREIFKFIK